ncbi:MAG TPA: hypothetical protein VMS87_11110 [Roseiarcus sp.]|nr:hypothetical protein [Roseiarcus sp.]
MAKASLRQISKRFGHAQLFSQFNLEVADGELLCLLGPSGSGETTLMPLRRIVPRRKGKATGRRRFE